MSAELKSRCATFLARAVPAGIEYVPDSMAERFIATYAKRGKLPEDDESTELLGLMLMETEGMIDQAKTPEAADYFRESASILEAILEETS